jgi:hypothetical protein
MREQVANVREQQAGFSGSAHFAFEDAVQRDFAIEGLIKIVAVHAYHALAATEGVESLLGESAIAAKRPRVQAAFCSILPWKACSKGATCRLSGCWSSLGSPEGIDRLDADEVLLIVGYNDAAVRFSGSGDNRIERAARLALGFAVSHQARPYQGGRLVERKYPAGE